MNRQVLNKNRAEMVDAESEMLRSGIHKLINSILNKDEKPQQWNKSSNVPIYQNGNKTDKSNYSEMSML
jgi:hypothetical protein